MLIEPCTKADFDRIMSEHEAYWGRELTGACLRWRSRGMLLTVVKSSPAERIVPSGRRAATE